MEPTAHSSSPRALRGAALRRALRRALGARTRNEPALGARTRNEPALGARTRNEPALGARTRNEPALGARTGNEPALGARTGNEPALGARTGNEPALGARTRNEWALAGTRRAPGGSRDAAVSSFPPSDEYVAYVPPRPVAFPEPPEVPDSTGPRALRPDELAIWLERHR